METGVSKKQMLVSFGSLAIILGGLYFVFRQFGIIEVQTTIEQAGIWAPLVLIVAKASTIIIAPLGGSVIYPLAGALFGFWKGLILIILGDLLGGVVSFYLSRIFGRPIVEKMLGDDQRFLSRALKMMGTVKGFLIARVCFAAFPEVVTYGAGLTRIPFIPFVLIHVAIGIVPEAFFVGLGSALTLNSFWVFPVVLLVGTIVIPAGFLLFRSVLKEWESAQ